MHRNNNGWMALPVVASLALEPAIGDRLSARVLLLGNAVSVGCARTGVGDVDRFRFSLGLTGEGRTEAAALKQLNQRLASLRRDLTPLMQGTLTVPAPVPSTRGDRAVRPPRCLSPAPPSLERWGLERYDALIQLAGGRPGVRLQGMTSLANAASALADEQRAVARALERGRQRPSGLPQHRPQAGQASADRPSRRCSSIDAGACLEPAMGFDPSEAPKPVHRFTFS